MQFCPRRPTSMQPVQPAPAPVDMDEEAQLQLALSLSKEEHQQVGLLQVVTDFCCYCMLVTIKVVCICVLAGFIDEAWVLRYKRKPLYPT